MKQDNQLVFNIEHLKVVPENLDGFESFCQTHEDECFGGYHFFKLFSREGELGDFHDKPIYEYQENPEGEKSLYTHICDAFEELNAVIDAIVKGEVSHFAFAYLKSNRCENIKNNQNRWETYQDYIDSGCYDIYELAFKFFEREAVGSLLAGDLYQKYPKELKKLNDSTILTSSGYSKFYDDIAFVVNINSFTLFTPEGDGYSTINRANRNHERLRMKLRVASFYQAIYYYWLFIMFNTEGRDKEINDLKSQVNKEKAHKFLMAGRVDLSHINNDLSLYYKKSNKSKLHNPKQELEKGNYKFIEMVMDQIIAVGDMAKLKSSFKNNKSQFLFNKNISSKVNIKIEQHNSLLGEDKVREHIKMINTDKTIKKHIEKYFENKK